MNKNTAIESTKIGIKKIKEIGFFWEGEKDISQASLSYHIEINTNLHAEKEEVEVIVSATFKDKEDAFLSIKVATTFYIEHITQFIDKTNALHLPEQIGSLISEISFAHTRALLARNTNGTAFELLILPVIDAKNFM